MQISKFLQNMNFPRRRKNVSYFWMGVAAGAGVAAAMLAPFAAGPLKAAVESGARTSKKQILRGMDAMAPVLATAGNWIEHGREKVLGSRTNGAPQAA